MKEIILAFLLFSASTTVNAQKENDKQAVHQAVISLFDALSNRDAASVRNYCTSDVVFNEYGEAWPLDTLINKAITRNTAADFKRENKLDFVSTNIKGDIAWATYYLQSDFSNKNKTTSVRWMETVVLMLDKKQWKINVLHSTRLK